MYAANNKERMKESMNIKRQNNKEEIITLECKNKICTEINRDQELEEIVNWFMINNKE